MARKFSLKDNPIFQRLEVPKPKQAIEDTSGDSDQEPKTSIGPQLVNLTTGEGQILTLKNRSSTFTPLPQIEKHIFEETYSPEMPAKALERDDGKLSPIKLKEYNTTNDPVSSIDDAAKNQGQDSENEEGNNEKGGSIFEPQNLRLKNRPSLSPQNDQENSLKNNRVKDGEHRPTKEVLDKYPLEDHLEKSQFFGFYNEVTDNLLPALNPAEQILYSRLFRLSYGFNRNYCTVSHQLLRERTGLSRNTVRTSLQSLILQEWLYVVDAGNHISTTYRVVLPREKNQGSNFDPQNLTPNHRGSKTEGQILRRKSRGSKIEGHEGQKTDLQNLTLRDQKGNFSNNERKIDRSGSNFEGQILTPLLLTNNSLTLSEREKKSLSLNEEVQISATQLVDSFYQLISQKPASTKKERGVTECSGLLQDGFSTEQIQYAIQWTVTNLPGTGSFSRVVHFIDQALRDRQEEEERIEKTRTHDLDQKERRQKERQREEDEKRIDELRGLLSSAEMEQFTSEATELVTLEHGDLRYGRETLIQIKIRELIRRRYLVS